MIAGSVHRRIEWQPLNTFFQYFTGRFQSFDDLAEFRSQLKPIAW